MPFPIFVCNNVFAPLSLSGTVSGESVRGLTQVAWETMPEHVLLLDTIYFYICQSLKCAVLYFCLVSADLFEFHG